MLVGRKGDTYSSLVPDLLQKQDFVFNHRLWGDAAGMHEQRVSETARDRTKKAMAPAHRKQIEQLRQIAAWRILKGNRIK